MWKRPFTIVALALMVQMAISAEAVLADGCYVGEVAHLKPPAIPRQRAMLVHRGGTEQLVIESSLDAEGQRFGWIIPVPAPPANLARVTPGVLDTLGIQTEPRISHGGTRDLLLAAAIAFIGFTVCVVILSRPSARLALACLLSPLVVCSLLPHLATSMGFSFGDMRAVDVRERSQVGNYEVTVLDAGSADALETWLKDNGFSALPSAGHDIVEDYIRDKWSFVVAKLRREESGGLCSPHPLAMSFAAQTAVYPMRLTSLSASPVALDLYVLADYQAGAEGLRLDFSDVLTGPESRPLGLGDSQTMPLYRCRAFNSSVGLPSLTGMLWYGCVLTRLSAELQPEAMSQDFRISRQSPEAFRRHWYSRKGALMTGVIAAALAWSVLSIVAASVVRARRGSEPGWRVIGLRVFLSPTVVGLAIVGPVYLLLPKVPVVVTEEGKMARVFGVFEIRDRVEKFARSQSYFPGMGTDQVRARCRSWLREEMRMANPFTGQLIREQEAPGDYQIIERNDRPMFWAYGSNGFPLDAALWNTDEGGRP